MTETPAMQAARHIFRPTNDQAVEQVAELIEALELSSDRLGRAADLCEAAGNRAYAETVRRDMEYPRAALQALSDKYQAIADAEVVL